MKRFILGLVLLGSGIVGFVGFLIACVKKGGVYSGSVFCYVNAPLDWIILSVYAMMSVVGFILALVAMKEKKEKVSALSVIEEDKD